MDNISMIVYFVEYASIKLYIWVILQNGVDGGLFMFCADLL